MCQFNYTIIKNKESISYLTKHGYGCLHTFPNGYKAFGGNRPGLCDCSSMVGSHSLTFREEGKTRSNSLRMTIGGQSKTNPICGKNPENG